MFSTKMRTALLQATALCTISMMLEHHTSALVFDAVWDDESFTNMVDAVNMSAVSYNNINRGQLALDSGEISSITTTRDHTNEFQNATPRDPFAFPKEAFYSHCLPRRCNTGGTSSLNVSFPDDQSLKQRSRKRKQSTPKAAKKKLYRNGSRRVLCSDRR
jgi:hypothetical protein